MRKSTASHGPPCLLFSCFLKGFTKFKLSLDFVRCSAQIALSGLGQLQSLGWDWERKRGRESEGRKGREHLAMQLQSEWLHESSLCPSLTLICSHFLSQLEDTHPCCSTELAYSMDDFHPAVPPIRIWSMLTSPCGIKTWNLPYAPLILFSPNVKRVYESPEKLLHICCH